MARTIIALGLLLLAGTAAGQRSLVLVEDGLEGSLASVTMPNGPAGTVIVERECPGCEPRSLRASSDIRYFIGDTVLPHAEFMAEVARMRNATDDPGDVSVGVFFSRESGRVTRIKVFTDE